MKPIKKANQHKSWLAYQYHSSVIKTQKILLDYN